MTEDSGAFVPFVAFCPNQATGAITWGFGTFVPFVPSVPGGSVPRLADRPAPLARTTQKGSSAATPEPLKRPEPNPSTKRRRNGQ
jgi:hypothetical protein